MTRNSNYSPHGGAADIGESVWRDLHKGRCALEIGWRIDAHSPQGRQQWDCLYPEKQNEIRHCIFTKFAPARVS